MRWSRRKLPAIHFVCLVRIWKPQQGKDDIFIICGESLIKYDNIFRTTFDSLTLLSLEVQNKRSGVGQRRHPALTLSLHRAMLLKSY